MSVSPKKRKFFLAGANWFVMFSFSSYQTHFSEKSIFEKNFSFLPFRNDDHVKLADLTI